MLCNAIWLVSAGPGTDGTSSAFYVDLGMLFHRIISIDKRFIQISKQLFPAFTHNVEGMKSHAFVAR